jgi:hypothetical protein
MVSTEKRERLPAQDTVHTADLYITNDGTNKSVGHTIRRHRKRLRRFVLEHPNGGRHQGYDKSGVIVSSREWYHRIKTIGIRLRRGECPAYDTSHLEADATPAKENNREPRAFDKGLHSRVRYIVDRLR